MRAELLRQKSCVVTAVAAVLVAGASWASASIPATPISVTGYTRDVIYEVGATGSGHGSFANEGQALYEQNLNGHSAGGLPSSGLITSAVDGSQFQLASFTSNNALIVAESGSPSKFATWTFASADKKEYSSVSVLGLCSGGPGNFSLVFFFTDGSNTSSHVN